jgi:uncharacterized membrane protein AbrB (regulator of aidB expression)
MTKKKKDRSPLVLTLALLVGLTAQLLGGPVAGLLGAAVAATAGGVAVRIHDHLAS